MNQEEAICQKTALIFSGQVWADLTGSEMELVEDLYQAGWFDVLVDEHGRVGKVNTR